MAHALPYGMETVLYQNKTFLQAVVVALLVTATPASAEDFSNKALWSSHEKLTQVKHSKELMGNSYRRSVVKRAESFSQIPTFIYSTVKARLEERFKKESGNLTNAILTESRRYGFDPLFLMAVIQTESGFDPHARGQFGEIGLMQIKPDTAAWIAKKYGIEWKGADSLKIPSENVKIGAAYFAFLRGRFHKKGVNYISAYNMGPANMFRAMRESRIPVEYHSRVMGRYLQFYAQIPVQMKELRIVASSAILKSFSR